MGELARLTSKGQLTMPKAVRDRLGLKTGDMVEFVVRGDEIVVVARNRSVMELSGILHRPGMKPVSVEEMDAAVGDFVTADDARVVREWREDPE